MKTVVIGLSNDDESWRESQFEGFRSSHAFAVVLLIDQDRELQERATDPLLTREEFVSLVHMAARRCFVENREPVLVTDDVLRDLHEHYECVKAELTAVDLSKKSEDAAAPDVVLSEKQAPWSNRSSLGAERLLASFNK